MTIQRLISASVAIGLVLVAVFGVLLGTMVRSARETHRTIERLQSVDEAVKQVMGLYVAIRDLAHETDTITMLGRQVERSVLDRRVEDVRRKMAETDRMGLSNPILATADSRYPADLAAHLDAVATFSQAMRAIIDPRQMSQFIGLASRNEGLRLTATADAAFDRILAMREEARRITVARLRMWEVSAFWWLLVGANLVLLGAIAAAGLLYATRTNRRQAAKDLANASAIAAAADMSRSRFLAAASHDLRQPLQAVTLFTAALRRRVADPYVTSLIEGVSAAAMSLDRMFNGLLDISKLDAGIVAAERTDFPIMRLLHNVEGEFKAIAQAKGLGLTMICNNAAVHTDPVLLESMVRNLVSNAIKYTQQGQVIVACRTEDRMVVIDVCDTGAGISDDEQEGIFQEFHRVASAASTEEGLGLGLAIVRRLSILLGVEISLRSILGIGSTFTMRVPRSTTALAEAEEIARPRPPVAVSPMRILLLDDDTLLRRAMVAELTALGMRVAAFGRADDVFALFATKGHDARFDVALMDFNLGPGPNGVEVLDRLAVQFGLALPALIMTGETDPVVLEELGDSGYAWLQKPVAGEIVVAALSRLLHADDDSQPDDLLSALQRSTEEVVAVPRISTDSGRAMAIT